MFIPGSAMVSLFDLGRALFAENEAARYCAHGRWFFNKVVEIENRQNGPFYAPAYICAEAMQALKRNGQKVIFYPVRKDLRPDWEWLDRQAKTDGGMLLLVHYFGFVNDIDRAKSICQKKGLVLIEDCAHSFLSKWRGQAIGTLGDYGVYSYRKVLPVPDGAELVSNKLLHSLKMPAASPSLSENLKWLAKQLAKCLGFKLGLPLRSIIAPSETKNDAADLKCSNISARIIKLSASRHDEITRKRRDNYTYLSKAFSGFPEIRPLFEKLPEGVCPWVFPVLTDSSDNIRNKLLRAGVPVSTWPDLPAEIEHNDEFKTARWLRQNILIFPIHQDITQKHLDRYLAAYKKARQ